MPYLSKREIIEIINGKKETIELVKDRLDISDTYCDLCGKLFVQERQGTIYCSNCKGLSYDVKINEEKKIYRNEYKRMYARKARGKITKEEFEEWKKTTSQ